MLWRNLLPPVHIEDGGNNFLRNLEKAYLSTKINVVTFRGQKFYELQVQYKNFPRTLLGPNKSFAIKGN